MPNWEFFIVRSYATGLLSKHECRVTQFWFLDTWIQMDLYWFDNYALKFKFLKVCINVKHICWYIMFLKFTVNLIDNKVDLRFDASYSRQWMSPKGQFTELQGEVDSLVYKKRQYLLTNCTLYRYINTSIVQLKENTSYTNLSINQY